MFENTIKHTKMQISGSSNMTPLHAVPRYAYFRAWSLFFRAVMHGMHRAMILRANTQRWHKNRPCKYIQHKTYVAPRAQLETCVVLHVCLIFKKQKSIITFYSS